MGVWFFVALMSSLADIITSNFAVVNVITVKFTALLFYTKSRHLFWRL